jgi:hypothetical protein
MGRRALSGIGAKRPFHARRRMSALGKSGHAADIAALTGFDPKATLQLFRRHPPRCICAGCELAPNDVDVAAQIVQLIRET